MKKFQMGSFNGPSHRQCQEILGSLSGRFKQDRKYRTGLAAGNKGHGKGAPEGPEEPQVSSVPSLPVRRHVAVAAVE